MEMYQKETVARLAGISNGKLTGKEQM